MGRKILTLIVAILLSISTVFCGCSEKTQKESQTPGTAADSAEIVLPNYNQSKTAKVTVKKTSTPTLYSKKVNDKIDIEDNIFLDALNYTGYNLKKHQKDGLMWNYILWGDKEWRGWLSDISYGAGASGLEKTSSGKPNIKAFERGGLVCASFATYVYFNYLPNVKGIDTSYLARPKNTQLANDWKKAAESWVKKGYSKEIKFSSYKVGHDVYFTEKSYMPIGSIVIFRDDYANSNPNSTHGSHVAIYVGKKAGYHWLIHVGNKNGPEFCAIERINYGPDPQMPIKVISTPRTLKLSAKMNVTYTVKGTAKKGVKIYAVKKNGLKKGRKIYLGKTNKNGKITKDGLAFGKYDIVTKDGKKLKTVVCYAKDQKDKNVTIKVK